MANKRFTEEEMQTLRASPHVLEVSPSIVHFSAAFKEKFWISLQAGKKPREIVIELGIDPEILGEYRVAGLKTMIGKEVKAGNGFRDLNTYSRQLNGFMSDEVKIRCLEQQLAYKEQEIEFLKKIASLGKGAQDT